MLIILVTLCFLKVSRVDIEMHYNENNTFLRNYNQID